MKTLRQTVSECMVRIHGISPELADYHVRQMTPLEVKGRFLMYIGLAEAELSVAGPKPRARQRSFYPVFPSGRQVSAGSRHSTVFPEKNRNSHMPDLEVKNREEKRDQFEVENPIAPFGLV